VLHAGHLTRILYAMFQLVNQLLHASLFQLFTVLHKLHPNRSSCLDETQLAACPNVRGLLAAILHCCEYCVSGWWAF